MSGIVGSKFNHRGSGLIGSLGTDGQHMLSSGAGKKHVFETVAAADLTPVRQDVLTLALKQAVQENSTKFNLPNSAITKFEADADFNLGGSTDIVRNDSEYISSITGGWTVDTNIALDTNLLAHYPWDNSDDDLKDTNELTAVGSPTYSTGTKKLGTHALELNADTEMFSFTSGAPSWGSPSAISMATWAYWSGGSDYDMIFDGYGTGSSQSFNFAVLESTDYMATYDDGTREWAYSTSTVDKDTWVHLAYVLTTTAKKFYLNGTLVGSSAGSYTLGTANAHNRIGARSGNTHGFPGYLDQTLFWNKEISAQEVTDLYNSDTGNTYVVPSVSATGTALGTTNVPTSAVTDVSGVMLLKNEEGTATLGTDVKAYFTADNSNWTEADSYTDAGTFSTGIKMIKLGKTTCTSGSDVRWKIEFANQSDGSLETFIYGIGLNY
jgi:hypothetical protein